MSLFECWYAYTGGDRIHYFYVGENPPAQEYRLDGDQWVSLGPGIPVMDKMFKGEFDWERCDRPDGAPNPPAPPKWDPTTGWILPPEGAIVPPAP